MQEHITKIRQLLENTQGPFIDKEVEEEFLSIILEKYSVEIEWLYKNTPSCERKETFSNFFKNKIEEILKEVLNVTELDHPLKEIIGRIGNSTEG